MGAGIPGYGPDPDGKLKMLNVSSTKDPSGKTTL